MEHFFSILGGMGTMATESFVHLLNERVVTHKDQDYLNYVLLIMRRFQIERLIF